MGDLSLPTPVSIRILHVEDDQFQQMSMAAMNSAHAWACGQYYSSADPEIDSSTIYRTHDCAKG